MGQQPTVVAAMSARRPRLLFFIAADWFFCSHFLDRAVEAREQGFDVSVLTRVRDHADRITGSGLQLVPIEIGRGASNPVAELNALRSVVRSYRSVRPDIVHHIALKPIVFGTVAARLAGVRRVVNAPVGMGFVFSSGSLRARLLRPAVRAALRLLLNPEGSRVVFENRDDMREAVTDGLVSGEDAVLIRGAGVDLDRFRPGPAAAGPPTVVLVARMLREKGIEDFVEAARILRHRRVAARFLVAGAPDLGNPGTISESELRRWHEEGAVEWIGQRDDVEVVLASAHVACLPSYYREGLPKSLLEGLAAGLPIVTTDVPGCRETVLVGENGLLVPPRDPQRLAEALATLIGDADMRVRFGMRSRQLAEAEFGTAKVSEATLALYRSLL
jgi:glycosyltransferase involved in cell wall biosynthesis